MRSNRDHCSLFLSPLPKRADRTWHDSFVFTDGQTDDVEFLKYPVECCGPDGNLKTGNDTNWKNSNRFPKNTAGIIKKFSLIPMPTTIDRELLEDVLDIASKTTITIAGHEHKLALDSITWLFGFDKWFYRINANPDLRIDINIFELMKRELDHVTTMAKPIVYMYGADIYVTVKVHEKLKLHRPLKIFFAMEGLSLTK